jgi:hypothetical protein
MVVPSMGNIILTAGFEPSTSNVSETGLYLLSSFHSVELVYLWIPSPDSATNTRQTA